MQSTTFNEQVVSITRTTLGDGLRSVLVFTADDHDILYMRQDIASHGERARTIKAQFVDAERLGFEAREIYNKELVDPVSEPDLGEYEFTIRVFTHGFVTRVIGGDVGVMLTTDDIDVDAFEDLSVSLRRLLAVHEDADPSAE